MAQKSTEETTRGTWRDWCADRAIRTMIWALMRLPWDARSTAMGAIMARVVAPLAGWRARAEANLAFTHPDMSTKQRRAIANASARNAGRTMIENYDIPGLLSKMAKTDLAGDGLSALEEARAQGRPVLLVTGHYGNHEAPRAALVARGYQIGGLYRPMSNPYFNAHYAANMHALSDPVFEQGRRGTMGLIKHIRNGGMGVLLFDVYDSAGVPIEFMGKPAPTLTSAADIALRTDALLIPFFGLRGPDGLSLTAVIEQPIPHGDPVEMMRTLTHRLETHVRSDPGQWFWIHRRWKPRRQERAQRKRAAATMGP